MSYERTKKVLTTFLVLYTFIGVGAHVTSVDTEDAYPFFSWFLFVKVPPRIQTGFDVVLVSVDGKRLETPAPLLSRPDVFGSEGLTERDLSAMTGQFARLIRGKRNEQIAEARREFEARFNTRVSYAVREYSYNTLEYFKNKNIASSTVLAEFLVAK